MLTTNERKVLRFLMASFSYNSINHIAEECKITPNGAYKILKKFEKFGVLYFENVGRIKAYRINFGNPLTLSYLEIALTDERINDAKIKVRIKDLRYLSKLCKAAVIFGSYITDKKNPLDIDLLFVFEKDKFNLYKKKLKQVKEILPYKVHDVIQTPEDLVNNLRKQDSVVKEIIVKGVVLWGHEIIARSVKNAQTG